MEYENHKTTISSAFVGTPGSIMVTRNTHLLDGAARDVIIKGFKALAANVPGYDWDINKIHFMLTRGGVWPHRGGTRNVSINIGLKNSNQAVTEFAHKLEDW